jgi:hypothetical protein
LPLAIDIEDYSVHELPELKDKIVIVHGSTDRNFKGSSFITEAIFRLINEGFPIEYKLVEKATHKEMREHYVNCHIYVDQILAGWYGTAAIEAMAISRPVISFIRQEYLENWDCQIEIPIISANPDTFYDILKETVESGFYYWKDTGEKCRKYVEEVHDSKKVVNKLEGIYLSLSKS